MSYCRNQCALPLLKTFIIKSHLNGFISQKPLPLKFIMAYNPLLKNIGKVVANPQFFIAFIYLTLPETIFIPLRRILVLYFPELMIQNKFYSFNP